MTTFKTYKTGDIRMYFPKGGEESPRPVILKGRNEDQFWLIEEILSETLHEDISWFRLGKLFNEMELLAWIAAQA